MKKNIQLFIFLFLITGLVKAQILDSLAEKRIAEAYLYTIGYQKPYYPEKAFEIYMEYANKGVPKAMNAVGMMYLNGLGVDSNYVEAAKWFEKAGRQGYAQGWYNLGMVHKYNYGVNQDFEKAFSYYKIAAQMGLINGKYATGYMLYKGLGCNQDYKEAYNLFYEASNAGHAGSMYMLGLCYRNGYGIERDSVIAKKWLKKSDSLKYYMAKIELASKAPENAITAKSNNSSARVINPSSSLNDIEIPKTYRIIKKNFLQEKMSGEYIGYVITFDYSGEHIIKQTPLRLQLKEDGQKISGQWIEGDNLIADIRAVFKDSSFTFESSQYKYSDHYNSNPVLWHFKNANVEILKKNNTIHLAGNLQLFSHETMEPEKPIYISLSKVEHPTQKRIGEDDRHINDLIAFPNPFANQLNLSFELRESSKVEITVFNMVGVAVHKATFDSLPKGKNLQSLPLEIISGIYVVRVSSIKGTRTSFIVRQ